MSNTTPPTPPVPPGGQPTQAYGAPVPPPQYPQGYPQPGFPPPGQPTPPVKGKKPIYKRVWFIILAVLVVLIIIGSVAGGGGGNKNAGTAVDQPAVDSGASSSSSSSSSSSTSAPAPKATAPAVKPKPAAPAKPSDKDWVVQSTKLKNDGLGDWGGTARITNNSGDSRTMVCTITLFRAGKQIASLEGSAQDVAAHKTVTVDLISEDKYHAGKYSVDFQVDTTY
jgi:hypothetical protein